MTAKVNVMRKSSAAFSVVLALSLTGSLVQALEITSRELGPGKFEFVVSNDAPVPANDARALIAIVARSACQGQPPVAGAFHIETADTAAGGAAPDAPPAFRFAQEITCGGQATNAAGAQGSTLTADKKKELNAEIRQLTEEHFNLVDARRFDVAFRDMGSGQSKEQWQFERESFMAESGKLQEFKVIGVDFLQDPAGAPRPGLYLGVVYNNKYETVPLECGFFVWQQLSEHEFRVVSAGHRYVTSKQFDAMDPAERTTLEQRLGCPRPSTPQEEP